MIIDWQSLGSKPDQCMFRLPIVRPRGGTKQLNLLIPCDDTAMATFVIQSYEVITYTTV